MKVGIGFTTGIFVILSVILLQYVSAQDQNIRLSGDSQPLQGRVEIHQNGQWGTVCIDDGWDLAEATVICRQLGLPYAQALSTTSARFNYVLPGWGSDILLSSVQCSGQEGSLAECQSQPPGEDTGCTHYDDVVVTCALPGFRGCYANVPDTWIEQRSHQSQLTVNSCLDACRRSSFLVGAMSDGEFCWCSNDGTIAGGQQLSPEQCNAACVGNDKQFCGGTDEETSIYTTNLGGAYITDPNIYNPSSGMIASPSFPGAYSTSMKWQFDFPGWVTIEVRLPFFNLPIQDLLVFTNRENGVPLEVRSGDGGASGYFVIGPLRALDVSLQDNGVPGGTENVFGFLLIYQVSPATAPTRPPEPPAPTTTIRPTTTDAPTTTRPPPPPPTIPPPPPLTTTLPQAPTTTPPLEPTRAKTTTAKPPTTTRPRPKTTAAESTTIRRPQPPTAKSTTTKKKTTTAKSTEPPPPPPPEQTNRPPVRSSTAKTTTAEDVSRRRLVDWWFEFWTFICVSVFVVGMVSLCLICWKSGQWKWLKRNRRRHHVIHRRHSSHSSWSDHYNFSLGDEDGYQHKHRRNSDDSSQCSHSPRQHHRRHRRHSSHSSWSSTWAPSTPSRRSLSSSSQSSHSSYRNQSTQYLIDPNNHSYPGVIYHQGYPGRPPVAYPIIYDPTLPHDPAMPPHDPMASQDPIPLDPMPPLDPMQSQDSIPPQDSVQGIDPMSEVPPTLPLDPPSDFPPTSPPDTYIMPESHPAPPPAPPSPPLMVDPMRIPEAGPMHVFEDECGPSDFDNRPLDPVVLVATGPPPASTENELIVPEVEPYIVAENTGSGNLIKKSKKSKQKQRSASSSNNKNSDKRFQLFGFGKSKNKEPQHRIDAQYTAEEPPLEPMHVVEDECRPNEFNDGVIDPQPAIATAPPTASPDGDLIVPEVEPYIVAENTKFKSPIAESAEQKNKPGKRSKIFGFIKSRKKSSSYQFNAGLVAEDQYGEVEAIADPEIEAVISGLDQSIQQAEIDGITGTSISVDSEAAYNQSPHCFDNPVYGSSSAMGTSNEAGNRQHVNEVSNEGTPVPDVDDVFVVVQSSDGNRIEFIQSDNAETPKDFILPGEGSDEIPDDMLDMFGNGGNYIPPPPRGPPPPPPE